MKVDSALDAQILEYGWAGSVLNGEAESGDLHVVLPRSEGALVAVIDGLGHGPEAAHAARAAADILTQKPSASVAELFECCHEGLRKTRGVVMSLATLDARSSTLEWFGVGNVEAALLRAEHGDARSHASVTARGGVLGYRMPPVRTGTAKVAPGDLLVMATDGLHNGFASDIPLDWEPQAIADWLLAKYARGTDDALVLAARYLGAVR